MKWLEVKNLERKIVLASHGKFASGIKTSLEMIYGDVESITALDCYLTCDFDMEKLVSDLMEESKEKELVVITDIFGGSVNNVFLQYIQRANYYLIAGLNLPFLIELLTKLEYTENLADTIQYSLDSSKNSIQFCNKTMERKIEEEDF